MNLLAFDTSSSCASIAIASEKNFFTRTITDVKQHATLMLGEVTALLAEAGITLTDLQGIAFGQGPGSFTGIRIAATMATAMGVAHNLMLYPVSTLAAIAYQVFREHHLTLDATVLVAIDARMQQVYTAQFDHNLTGIETVQNPENIACNVLPALLAGYGLDDYLNQLPEPLQGIQRLTIYPNAVEMLKMVQEGLISPHTAGEALPVYIRNAVATTKGT